MKNITQIISLINRCYNNNNNNNNNNALFV